LFKAYISSFLAKIKAFQEMKTHFKILLIIYDESMQSVQSTGSEQSHELDHSEYAILEKYQIEMNLTAFLDESTLDETDLRSKLTIDDLRRCLRSIILKLSTTRDKLGPLNIHNISWKLWVELPDHVIERHSIDSILADQRGSDPSHYFIPSSKEGLTMDSSTRLHTLTSLDLCGGKGPRYEVVVSESIGLKKDPESIPAFSLATGSTT
jgi:hypothetical protein